MFVNLDLGVDLIFGCLSRALSEISWVCWPLVKVRVPRNTVMGSVTLVSSELSSGAYV